jgi:hypothetical protein
MLRLCTNPQGEGEAGGSDFGALEEDVEEVVISESEACWLLVQLAIK